MSSNLSSKLSTALHSQWVQSEKGEGLSGIFYNSNENDPPQSIEKIVLLSLQHLKKRPLSLQESDLIASLMNRLFQVIKTDEDPVLKKLTELVQEQVELTKTSQPLSSFLNTLASTPLEQETILEVLEGLYAIKNSFNSKQWNFLCKEVQKWMTNSIVTVVPGAKEHQEILFGCKNKKTKVLSLPLVEGVALIQKSPISLHCPKLLETEPEKLSEEERMILFLNLQHLSQGPSWKSFKRELASKSKHPEIKRQFQIWQEVQKKWGNHLLLSDLNEIQEKYPHLK